MRASVIRRWACVFALLTLPATAQAGWPKGIGVLGDSYSDEYQFYAPHRSMARNWVEILAETRGLNFGQFSTKSRGEPRNEGFAFNWARSDATTVDMIATGQHTGLAAQVARGEVDLVVIFIGGNDFINAMYAPDPAAAQKLAGPRAEENLQVALQAILNARSDVKVLLLTVPDIRDLPEFREPLRAGRLPRDHADAATAAIRHYNARIRELGAHEPRIAVLDCELVARASSLLYPDRVLVAGQPILRNGTSDDPGHLFLGDVRHLGTVGQGLMASLVVATIDARFSANVPPLSEQELLDFAFSTVPSLTASAASRPARSRPAPIAASGFLDSATWVMSRLLPVPTQSNPAPEPASPAPRQGGF